jgi:hypothetical protein
MDRRGFFAGMIALFVYSVISTSSEIRKKAQPTVDSIFDALYSTVLPRKSAPKGNPSTGPEKK